MGNKATIKMYRNRIHTILQHPRQSEGFSIYLKQLFSNTLYKYKMFFYYNGQPAKRLFISTYTLAK